MLKEKFLKDNKKQIIALTLLNGNQLRGRLINYDGECMYIAAEDSVPSSILVPYSSVLIYATAN